MLWSTQASRTASASSVSENSAAMKISHDVIFSSLSCSFYRVSKKTSGKHKFQTQLAYSCSLLHCLPEFHSHYLSCNRRPRDKVHPGPVLELTSSSLASTGGEFTRQAEVTFMPGNEKLNIRQEFKGIDEHDHLIVSTNLEGRVAEVPLGSTIKLDPYSEIYQYNNNCET